VASVGAVAVGATVATGVGVARGSRLAVAAGCVGVTHVGVTCAVRVTVAVGAVNSRAVVVGSGDGVAFAPGLQADSSQKASNRMCNSVR